MRVRLAMWADTASGVAEAASPVRIVLASQSPRRRDLLSLIGIAHTVRPANVDEAVQPDETPLACVQRLARTKAEHIAREDRGTGDPPVVIGADTIVVVDDRILNKPATVSEAREMLGMLQGRVHDVHTGVCVMWGERQATGVESVRVRFRALSDAEIGAYIATGEPMDKAGAYGIQGYGATIVDRVEGDFFAVMGLPLVRLVEMLREVGVVYEFGELGRSQVDGGEKNGDRKDGGGKDGNRKNS